MLRRGKTYYYRVAAVNDAQGTGPYSVTYGAPLLPARHHTGYIPELVATATGPNTIELTWNIPADNGTTLDGFAIQKWGDTSTTIPDDQSRLGSLG